MDIPPSQDPQAPPPLQVEPLTPLLGPAPSRTIRIQPLALIAPALAVVALALTIAGAFLPLFSTRQTMAARSADFTGFDPGSVVLTTTAWRYEISVGGQAGLSQPGAPMGIPVLIAAALLMAAAIAGVVYAFTRSAGALAKWLTLAGAAFVAGVAFTIGTQSADRRFASEVVNLTNTIEAGLWSLIAAAVVAVAAAAVSQLRWPEPTPAWADPDIAYADTATPPSGISMPPGVAITVLPPEPPPAAPWAPERHERS